MPVFVDSHELRAFAAQLQRFSETLNDNLNRTQGQMGQLAESWQDEEFEQFRNVFVKAAPLLRQFIEEANKTVPALQRDAEAIDEYSRLKAE